jgi:hypothetical protein
LTQEYKIIVFKSTFLTFKAERALKGAGLACKVVTKPRDISSDCGLAIRVDAADEQKAANALDTAGVEKLGIW